MAPFCECLFASRTGLDQIPSYKSECHPSVCNPSLRYRVHSQMKPFCALAPVLCTCLLHLCLPIDGPSDFATKILRAFLISARSALCPADLIIPVLGNIPQQVTVSIFLSLCLGYKNSAQNQGSSVRSYGLDDWKSGSVFRYWQRILPTPNRPHHPYDPPSLLLGAYRGLFLRR
jgi:hypothetical protein